MEEILQFARVRAKAALSTMQIICTVSLSPDRYANENFQRSIQRPIECPRCGVRNALLALGYYSRTLRAQDVAFCEFLCGGSDAVFVAEQSASFRHSRNHTGWF
jgi:hypothetical protein